MLFSDTEDDIRIPCYWRQIQQTLIQYFTKRYVICLKIARENKILENSPTEEHYYTVYIHPGYSVEALC